MEIVKGKEGERVLAHISLNTYVITLEINGAMLTSEQLAQKWTNLPPMAEAKSPLSLGDLLV
ncbi:hypothetical protein J8TS2_36640 [Lederbergia ruris]|uniref:Uncharacterized protein n=1 Tax=Lederbergia ruris TaxID=217495 RepID=A0ABQ4KN26_9BACI|nr:hypothetical protein J8TS2_36640 [Lederbergia ruris]